MKIKVGKYVIRSDRYSYWLEKVVTLKKGENAGKTREERITGFFTNMDGLIKDFVTRQFRDSDAETVAELLKAIRDIENDAKLLKETALKKDLKEIRRICKEKGVK